MQLTVNGVNVSGSFNATVGDIGECPLCHHAIEALPWGAGAYYSGPGSTGAGIHPVDLQIVLRCPRPACHRLFIARYNRAAATDKSHVDLGYWDFTKIEPRAHVVKGFPAEVQSLSKRFIEIFEQAAAAEEQGLDLICGAGYRKALEFLIKDFVKSFTTDEAKQANIEKTPLAACIANYVDDPRLKTTASRATWLGNDETHYVRKWEDKDLKDLKKLIDLTVHWVSAEILTGELAISMPDPKAAVKGE
jgi:hypothetical protein